MYAAVAIRALEIKESLVRARIRPVRSSIAFLRTVASVPQ
jgi:hypothetical protein